MTNKYLSFHTAAVAAHSKAIIRTRANIPHAPILLKILFHLVALEQTKVVSQYANAAANTSSIFISI
jgi:hypothetical protein